MAGAVVWRAKKIAYQTIIENRISASELKDLDVLILPNVVTISQKIVDEVLKPFLDEGKTLIITGEKVASGGSPRSCSPMFSSLIAVISAAGFAGSQFGIDLSSLCQKQHYKVTG